MGDEYNIFFKSSVSQFWLYTGILWGVKKIYYCLSQTPDQLNENLWGRNMHVIFMQVGLRITNLEVGNWVKALEDHYYWILTISSAVLEPCVTVLGSQWLNFQEFFELVDISLVAWHRPWWKYLYQRNQQILIFFFLQEGQLLNMYQHTTNYKR